MSASSAGRRVGTLDLIIVKWDAAGNITWLKQLPVDGIGGAIFDIASDGAGNLFVLGYYSTKLTMGSTVLTTPGNSNFLAKLDGNGDVVWVKTTIPGDPRYVRVDPAGNIVISGHFIYGANFGVASIPSVGDFDAYIWRLDAAGAPISVKTIGTWNNEFAPRISVDGAGRIVLSGNLSTAFDFGQGPKGPGAYNAKLIP